MGILWTVWPLNEEMKSWLSETGVDYPDVESRFPTGHEIKTALDELAEYDIRINDNGVGEPWQATIIAKEGTGEKEWTLLNITEYSGDTEPQELWFEKGWESLIKHVLHVLSAYCGPLVLMADTGGDPEVIQHNIPLQSDAASGAR